MSLEVINLSKKYGPVVAVESLSFSMEKPGIYALLGTNGAGKTTAIRMMLGMLAKDGGSVLWNGKELTAQTCNIGYLAEERGLYPKYELLEQLMYFASLRGVSAAKAKERIKYWAGRLEVEEYLYPPRIGKGKRPKPRTADQLSKGNQQKIQLMTALLSDPALLVLDEPLSGLDPVNTDIFRSIIHEQLEAGKYLIMSSHQMATVEEFCTDLTILHRSKAVLQGNLNEIKRGLGRVKLHVKVQQDIRPLIAQEGIELVSEKEYEYELKICREEQAHRLLGALVSQGVPVISFLLREPSLHEIFVGIAGDTHEA